jgi:hypothetical protein
MVVSTTTSLLFTVTPEGITPLEVLLFKEVSVMVKVLPTKDVFKLEIFSPFSKVSTT